MNVKGIIFTLFSAFLYGITPMIAKLTYGYGNNPLSMTFFRNLLAIPFLLILVGTAKAKLQIKRNDLKHVVIISIFGTTLTTVLLYSSYSSLDVGTATTLHFMYPVFVGLIVKYVFHEKLNRAKITALFLAFIGVIFFVDFQTTNSLLGVILATLSGFTYAFYMVWIDKTNISRYDPLVVSLYIAVIASLALLIGGLIFRFLVFDLSWEAYLLIIIVAASTSFIATVFLQKGIKEIGSTSAAIFSLLEPITSILGGVLILDESFTPAKAIGCTIIFSSILYLVLMQKKEHSIVSSK